MYVVASVTSSSRRAVSAPGTNNINSAPGQLRRLRLCRGRLRRASSPIDQLTCSRCSAVRPVSLVMAAMSIASCFLAEYVKDCRAAPAIVKKALKP